VKQKRRKIYGEIIGRYECEGHELQGEKSILLEDGRESSASKFKSGRGLLSSPKKIVSLTVEIGGGTSRLIKEH